MPAQLNEFPPDNSERDFVPPRLMSETLPGGRAAAAPHGTVQFDICPASGRLWISWDLDPDPEDWQVAMQMADTCVNPGQQLRCYERYHEGMNIMICFVEEGSPMHRVSSALAIL